MPENDGSNWRLHDWLIISGLFCITLILYARVVRFDFISFDDPGYVTENPHVRAGLTPESVGWAMFTGAQSNWHPVTWLSLMLDASLFGLHSGAYHIENVVIHAVNAALLYLLLAQMTRLPWPSAWVAAMFAWHPLHVESVAWISERKDVLSTLLMFLCLISYIKFVRTQRRASYVLLLVLFALGLMAKPMLVTLPVILLLLDIWPLNRGVGARIQEKLPLFALALASSIVTIIVQLQGNSLPSIERIPIGLRITNAIIAYGKYLWLTIAPSGLAVFYPHPAIVHPGVIGFVAAAAAATIILLISLAAWRFRRPMPWIAVGWAWYLVMLLPVIGIIQVGRQALADRYTYVPLVGVFIAVAWTVPRLVPRAAVNILAIASLVGAGATTFHQIGFWRDTETVMRRAADVVPDNYLAHEHLGRLYEDRGELSAAEREYREAIQINPNAGSALSNLALLVHQQGHLDEAMALYPRAIAADPGFVAAYNNYGNLLVDRDQIAEAIKVYRAAVDRGTDIPQAYHNLALALARQGEVAKAVPFWKQAIYLDPRYADAHYRLGQALLIVGPAEQGIEELKVAARLKPQLAETVQQQIAAYGTTSKPAAPPATTQSRE